MQDLIRKLDELIQKVKQKGDKDEFSFEDTRIIICCEIVRLELQESSEVSDLSFGAFCAIVGNSYQSFLGVQDDIHKLILDIGTKLYEFNKNEFKADIYVPLPHDRAQWYRYFGGAIRYLLEMK